MIAVTPAPRSKIAVSMSTGVTAGSRSYWGSVRPLVSPDKFSGVTILTAVSRGTLSSLTKEIHKLWSDHRKSDAQNKTVSRGYELTRTRANGSDNNQNIDVLSKLHLPSTVPGRWQYLLKIVDCGLFVNQHTKLPSSKTQVSNTLHCLVPHS